MTGPSVVGEPLVTLIVWSVRSPTRVAPVGTSIAVQDASLALETTSVLEGVRVSRPFVAPLGLVYVPGAVPVMLQRFVNGLVARAATQFMSATPVVVGEANDTGVRL